MPINRKRDDRVLVCCSARSRSTALGESRFSTGFEATGHQTEIEEKPVQTEAFTSSHLHIHENERVIELLMYGFLSKVTELTDYFFQRFFDRKICEKKKKNFVSYQRFIINRC